MRTRTFWFALPLAVVLALWLGSGLAHEDGMPPAGPVSDASEPLLDATDSAERSESNPTTPECEPAHDPGPDGDR